ncbi:hypothetical protein [Shimia aestuarii]|nr:hypothetical protein [Shimia aestuarii]
MRKDAKRLARLAAANCLDYETGRLRMVETDRARAILARVFERLFTAGGEPQVMRLEEGDASYFPSFDQAKTPEGCETWIAAGLDGAGAATYAIREIRVEGIDDPRHRKAHIQAWMLDQLGPELAFAGYPQDIRKDA